jgi:teichuronic acid biosynthesis glycosyltransferase TuaC
VSRSLRVLVVTNMYPTAADPVFGKFVQRQVESLRAVGVDVRVAIVAAQGRWDYVVGRRRLRRLIHESQPDLVHAHYGFTGVTVVGLRRPLIVTLCGDDVNGESDGAGGITVKSRIGILVTRVVTRFADRVLVMNRSMWGRLSAAVRARTNILPYGVDAQLFSPGPMEVAREHLGVPAGVRVVCFVNSGKQVTKRRGLAEAAVAELIRRGVPARLMVVDDVLPEDMPSYYRASDCLVMTSEREGSPSVVREALACGVPVVSVPVGDVREVIVRRDQGRVTGDDPRELAAALEDVLRDQALPRQSLLETAHTAMATTARLLELYEELLRTAVSRGETAGLRG